MEGGKWKLTMDSLIDNNTKWWNFDKVRAAFSPQIAAEVLKIVLSPKEQVEKLIWARERIGKYSVKSAYRLSIEPRKNSYEGECSNPITRKHSRRGSGILESLIKWKCLLGGPVQIVYQKNKI